MCSNGVQYTLFTSNSAREKKKKERKKEGNDFFFFFLRRKEAKDCAFPQPVIRGDFRK